MRENEGGLQNGENLVDSQDMDKSASSNEKSLNFDSKNIKKEDGASLFANVEGAEKRAKEEAKKEAAEKKRVDAARKRFQKQIKAKKNQKEREQERNSRQVAFKAFGNKVAGFFSRIIGTIKGAFYCVLRTPLVIKIAVIGAIILIPIAVNVLTYYLEVTKERNAAVAANSEKKEQELGAPKDIKNSDPTNVSEIKENINLIYNSSGEEEALGYLNEKINELEEDDKKAKSELLLFRVELIYASDSSADKKQILNDIYEAEKIYPSYYSAMWISTIEGEVGNYSVSDKYEKIANDRRKNTEELNKKIVNELD